MSPIALRSVFRRANPASDADLLAAFAATRDEAAFAELVRRHGRLVRGTARRVAGHPDAADDAVQATFLLLARKASAGAWGPTVGPWLYQVACRTARKARSRLARQPAAALADMPASPADPAAALAWAEVRAALDDELARLPTALCDPLVLCYLEGLTRDEAAAALGCSVVVVKGRLERGREKLRVRLARRGLGLSAALAGVLVAEPAIRAAEAATTARAAAAYLATGSAAPAVRELMRGAVGWKLAGLLAACAVVSAGFVGAPSPAPPPVAAAAARRADPPDAGREEPLPSGAVARLGTTRLRTGDMVLAIAFAPDGKRLAAWGNALYKYDQFTLWGTATGARLRANRTTENRLVAMAWPADGRGLAVLKSGVRFSNRPITPDLTLWEFSAAEPDDLSGPAGGPRGIRGMAPGEKVPPSFDAATLSADGKLLFAATSEGDQPGPVHVYEAKPAKSLTELKRVRLLDPPPVPVSVVAVTPCGAVLVGVGQPRKDGKPEGEKTVVAWDIATGKLTKQFPAPANAIQWNDFVLAVADGRAALGLETGDVALLDLKTGEWRTLATGHKGRLHGSADAAGVFALAFSPDGKTLATVGMDSKVRLTDVGTGKVIHVLGPHASWPQAVAFSRDGSRLASGGQDGVIRVWDTKTGADVCPTGGHPGMVWQVSLSADGKVAVTVCHDRTVRVWDAVRGEVLRRIDAGEYVLAAGLSPDGRHAVAILGRYDDPEKRLHVWDIKTGTDATPPGFRDPLPATKFLFTPDGKTLVTYHDDRLCAWRWPGGEKVFAVQMPKPSKQPGISDINSVTVSPDGRHLAAVIERSWSVEKKGLNFGYADAEGVDLLDTATGKVLRRLVRGASRPAVYAADGNLIVTGATRSTVVGVAGRSDTVINSDVALIDPLTGAVLREFAPSRHTTGRSSGHAVALSADGRALYRATDSGAVEEYEVATGGFRRALLGHRDTVISLATATADARRVLSGSRDTTALVWDTGAGTGAKPGGDPEKLWADLAEPDAEKAFAAMAALAAEPAKFAALVRDKVKPAPPGPTAAALDKVVADLDSPTFATRAAAQRALDRFGESAVPGVRARLEKAAAAEVRGRLTEFLGRHDAAPGPGRRLRDVRALEVLEHLGTADAKGLLKELAAGGPSRRTDAAAAALKRLAGR